MNIPLNSITSAAASAILEGERTTSNNPFDLINTLDIIGFPTSLSSYKNTKFYV